MPIYRTRAIYHNREVPFRFPLAKAYESSEWFVEPIPSEDCPTRPDESPQPDEEEPEASPDEERSIVVVEDGLEPPEGEERAARDAPSHFPQPDDKMMHLDFPFIFHGTTWFKGPFEIFPDGRWVRRRTPGYALGRCPGYTVERWSKITQFDKKDALWAECIST